MLPKFFDTGEKAERLKGLKDELKKKHTVSFFTTSEDLAKRITQDLPPLLKDIGVTVAKDRVAALDAEQAKEIATPKPKTLAVDSETQAHAKLREIARRIDILRNRMEVEKQTHPQGSSARATMQATQEDLDGIFRDIQS